MIVLGNVPVCSNSKNNVIRSRTEISNHKNYPWSTHADPSQTFGPFLSRYTIGRKKFIFWLKVAKVQVFLVKKRSLFKLGHVIVWLVDGPRNQLQRCLLYSFCVTIRVHISISATGILLRSLLDDNIKSVKYVICGSATTIRRHSLVLVIFRSKLRIWFRKGDAASVSMSGTEKLSFVLFLKTSPNIVTAASRAYLAKFLGMYLENSAITLFSVLY